MQLKQLFFIIILMGILLSSCNSLFYYPKKQMVASPQYLNLKYDSYTVSVDENVNLNVWMIHAKNEKPMATIIHFHGNGENIFCLACLSWF